jgi:hypothetical protein
MGLLKKAILIGFVSVCCSVAFGQSTTSGLKIAETTSYWEGNFAIVGLIQNNLDYTVAFVDLGLECWDKDGTLVQTESTYAECAIPPGWKVPFTFLISEDEASEIRKCRVSINDFSKGSPPNLAFTVSQLSITEKNDTYHKYSGYVTNNSKQIAKFVKVVFIGYDSAGKLCYVESSYPQKTTISSGGQSIVEFLVRPELSRSIAKYSAFAYAD